MSESRASSSVPAVQYAHEQRERFLEALKEYGAIPSISTDANAKSEMHKAAEWTAEALRKLGIQNVAVMPTPGHPVVFGEWSGAGPQATTVLVYGHYDVQPAEPLELWQSDAFEPAVRGEYIYGRGVTDMKGQVLATLFAIESIIKTGKLPVNLKFLIEGEEEIGSPSLADFMQTHQQLLSCDLALNPDSGILSAEQPSITYALRGLAYFELRLTGPDHDLHSGIFGGAVHNPAQVLCELIAGMHDAQGRVTLPDFYTKVLPLEAEERAELARLPLQEEYFRKESGAPALFGEVGYSAVEQVGGRPTLEVNGLLSGFTGEGSKTVLPSKAMAKISCRLVPDQDPDEIYESMRRYLEAHAPPTVTWELVKMAGGPASLSNRNSAGVQALSKAFETVWGVRPVFKREGGSVPVVTLFQQVLGVESVNTGFAMAGDNMHSPNEKLHLPTWYRGIDALIHFFYNLAEETETQ